MHSQKKKMQALQELFVNTWHFVSRLLLACSLICCAPLQAQECALWLIVSAPQLDYTSFQTLLQTISKHPRTGSKEGSFGHAWIRLVGTLDGQPIRIEGGHSGDTGEIQLRYVDGFMDHVNAQDPNPIRYLWVIQRDGHFQKGSGGHNPTYAIKISINEKQLRQLVEMIQRYPFERYALTGNQCVEFVRYVAEQVGINLPVCKQNVNVPEVMHLGAYHLRLWTDARYSTLPLSTTDELEQALKHIVREGKAQNATVQCRLSYGRKPLECCKEFCQRLGNFWEQYCRWRDFQGLQGG